MSITASTRRFALAMTLAVSLAMFGMALLGLSQTLAQAHASTCSSAHAKGKAKCATHACPHKGKGHHAAKCKHAKKHPKKAAAQAAAVCEDGSAPLRATSGSFSCADGSEPACENGAIPTRSGKRLVCPVIFEEEVGSGGEECEEGLESCSAGVIPGAATGSTTTEQVCEGSASEGSSALCEAES